MTLLEFTRNLCRWLTVKDPETASLEAAQEILTAVNAVVAYFFLVGPPFYRKRTFSFMLKPGYSRTLTVTQDSVTCSGANTEDIYRACLLPGDTVPNRLMTATTLRHAFSGASGSVSATFYGDGVALPTTFLAVRKDPIILESENRYPYGPLKHTNCRERLWKTWRPTNWWLEDLGQAENATPLPPRTFMRFWPVPDALYHGEVEIECRPDQFAVADIAAGVMPIEDELCNLILLPMVLGKLLVSPLWEDAKLQPAVVENAKLAYAMFAALPRSLSQGGLRFNPSMR